MIPGQNKLNQVACPPEKDPLLDSFACLPEISLETFKPQTLMDRSVFGKHVNQLEGCFFNISFIRRRLRFYGAIKGGLEFKSHKLATYLLAASGLEKILPSSAANFSIFRHSLAV